MTGAVDVDDLLAKLDAAERQIYDMVTAALPAVNVHLPQLPPDAFGPTPKPKTSRWRTGYDILPDSCRKGPDPSSPCTRELGSPLVGPGPSSATARQAQGVAAEAAASAAAAEARAREAAAGVEAAASDLAQVQSAGLRQSFGPPAAAAAASLGVACAAMYAELGTVVGPVIVACASTALNSMALAQTWQARSGFIFDVLESQLEKAKSKMNEIVDTIDDMILGPVKRLESAIDKLSEEQKPAMEKLAQLERTLKIDIPDPQDMKVPLSGCGDKVGQVVAEAKEALPAKVDELIRSTFAGRVATDRAAFSAYVVYMPMMLVFLVNLALALGQVVLSTSLHLNAATSTAQAGEGGESSQLGSRRLRGADVPGDVAMERETFIEGCMPYFLPALLQIGLSLLQGTLASALSQGPRVCKSANEKIVSLQKWVNDDLNSRIKEVMDKVVGSAFMQVRGTADSFFPQFRDALTKLKEAMDSAEKAQGAMRALGVACW